FITGLHEAADVLETAVANIGGHFFYEKSSESRVLLGQLRQALETGRKSMEQPSAAAPLEKDGVRVDRRTRQVWINSKVIPRLGNKRFDLLCALLQHEEGISKAELKSSIWGKGKSVKIVDKTIERLRADLAAYKAAVSIITIPGGYGLVG
ncbi:transcriptional regulator, partial [Elusimicrobiota bacterium]